MLTCARGLIDGKRSLREICEAIEDEALVQGLSKTCSPGFGDRSMPRRFELAAAINRLRPLHIKG